jgi:hypothetical protein
MLLCDTHKFITQLFVEMSTALLAVAVHNIRARCYVLFIYLAFQRSMRVDIELVIT